MTIIFLEPPNKGKGDTLPEVLKLTCSPSILSLNRFHVKNKRDSVITPCLGFHIHYLMEPPNIHDVLLSLLYRPENRQQRR